MGLSVFFSDAGSSPDNLLERGHALNRLVENNELGHLTVCTGGEQFRGCCNNGIWLEYRDEIVKFGLSVYV